MSKTPRWMQSAIATAARTQVALPFERGHRAGRTVQTPAKPAATTTRRTRAQAAK